MYKIYCITDCDNKKYVGKTKQTLKKRLRDHRCFINFCSSQFLNLNNSKIELIEECNKENSKERERYWINKIDCVNIIKNKGYKSERESKYEQSKKRIQSKKEWNKKNWIYISSWGGNLKTNNNLLKIDIDLFNYLNF